MRAVNQLFARLLALVLALTLSVQPALAQSILRDAETEILLHDMATPLIRAAGLDPRAFGQDSGDPALGPAAGAVGQLALGDDGHAVGGGQVQGGGQAGQPAADDQDVEI